MKNFVQKGDVVTAAAPYDRSSGQGALIGNIFGVASADVLSGADGEFQVEGVFDLTKARGSVSQGDMIFWDDSAKNCTKTATGNSRIGMATQAQASGDATVRVRLEPAYQSAASQADTTAADLAALKVDFNALLAKLRASGQMK